MVPVTLSAARTKLWRTPARSMTRNALIFDIETVADLTADNRDAVRALAEDRERTAEEFGALCPPLARVVCIAWLDTATTKLNAAFDGTLSAAPQPQEITVSGGDATPCGVEACDSEAQLLQRFGCLAEEHCRQSNAQLVTFNGRGFDLPVLVHRGIKLGVSAGRALYARALGENRYRPLLHLDLMDVV